MKEWMNKCFPWTPPWTADLWAHQEALRAPPRPEFPDQREGCKERQCSRWHRALPSWPLPTPSAWTGLELAFPENPRQGRESQATQRKINRSEALESLLMSQGTCGDLNMSTSPLTLLPQKTQSSTTPLPFSLNDPLGKNRRQQKWHECLWRQSHKRWHSTHMALSLGIDLYLFQVYSPTPWLVFSLSLWGILMKRSS